MFLLQIFGPLVLWITCGLIGGQIAAKKGYPNYWYFLGALLGIVNLIIAVALPSRAVAVPEGANEPVEVGEKPSFKERSFAAIKKVAGLLGIQKNSKYVRNHMAETNTRNTVFMGFVIMFIEVWMIIRQFDKYLLPAWAETPPTFLSACDDIYHNTSGFILFLLVGAAIANFGYTYGMKRWSAKAKLVSNLACSGISFFFCISVFFENYQAWGTQRQILANSLLIAIYIAAALLSLALIANTIIADRTGSTHQALTTLIMTLFALMCFAFGVKVSYSDYTSSNHKEIICFLTMSVYWACLLIWRPFVSIAMNTAAFIVFYKLIEGATIGVMSPWKADADQSAAFIFAAQFKDGDFVNYITFLISLCMVSISIYHQRRAQAIKDEELEFHASYDELTGLHNASYFVREVEANNDGGGAVLFLNVANFKAVNDQKGFEEGNECLKGIAKILSEEFSLSLVARQSDDHFFAYVLRQDPEKVLASCNERLATLVPGIALSFKAGLYRIREGEDPRRATDKARYAASTVRDDMNARLVEYDEKMHKAYHLLQYVIRSVDKAVEEGWIKPYYQPVVWSKDGKLCGAEALARWEDPDRGLLPPGQFIPTLENAKLIHKVDAKIFETVCRDIRASMDAGLPIVPVSVNISRLDFELMDVIKVLEDAIAKYNVPKEFLHVEITESALTDDESLLNAKIHEIKRLGYALWLDDFGSGYSSLNVLKDFDFDVMKMDMKFLSGLGKNKKVTKLLDSVIAMAKTMGMRTLCEGVETKEQLAYLTDASCERIQGYINGKPMPLEELQRKVKDGELALADHFN